MDTVMKIALACFLLEGFPKSFALLPKPIKMRFFPVRFMQNRMTEALNARVQEFNYHIYHKSTKNGLIFSGLL